MTRSCSNLSLTCSNASSCWSVPQAASEKFITSSQLLFHQFREAVLVALVEPSAKESPKTRMR